MINAKVLKVSKRVAIVLLIAVFSVAGIVACGGAEDISGSGSDGFVENPENPNPVTPGTPDSEPVTDFSDDTYMWVYSPFSYSHGNEFWVSYMDTNNLNLLWKRHVARTGSNDNIRWIIRDGDNKENDPKVGNYYYFDNNADIVHAGKYADKVRVKEFVGGVIVRYNQDNTGKKSDVWSIGGLYKTLLNKDANNTEGQQGYGKYNNENFNEFMRATHNREEGDLSIILLNTGYATYDKRFNFTFSYEFGVDEYYSTTDDNYRKDASCFLGKNPTEYYDTKLNAKVNHSRDIKNRNFRFTMAEAENWWASGRKVRVNLKNYKF